MRTSSLYAPTRRNPSTDPDSCDLLTRAGFIHQHAAGIYAYLPLMNRVLAKIENIIREEMTKQGAQELHMPVLQRKEMWEQSGRWQEYIQSGTMFRLKDRKSSDLALGPTHEEVICDLVKDVLRSHRQMPINLFQIGPKFRDEFRPRLGLLRCREFIMKDAYSFDKDDEGLDVSYRKMILAYGKVFGRCGLDFVMVEADSGPIGGKDSHEFMALADRGEDVILICNACRYAANQENAVSKPPSSKRAYSLDLLGKTTTPNASPAGAHQVWPGLRADQLVKTLFFRSRPGELVAALIPNDAVLNESKLRNAVGWTHLPSVSYEEICESTGSARGLMNFNRPLRIVADESVRSLTYVLPGPNQSSFPRFDLNSDDLNSEQESRVPQFSDIRNAISGDRCARCEHGLLAAKKGIEVGHVFKLGTRYSKPMGLTYTDQGGKEKPILMGCYGIGVSRIVAAVVEQNHDDKGIVWPANIAPFTTVVIPAKSSHRPRAEQVYDELQAAGVDVILDDRDVSFGVKSNDADLIGYPYKAIVGDRAGGDRIEVQERRHGEAQMLHMKEVPVYLKILNR